MKDALNPFKIAQEQLDDAAQRLDFGNAGQYAALLGEEILGLKLVAASDSKGGVYKAEGIGFLGK